MRSLRFSFAVLVALASAVAVDLVACGGDEESPPPVGDASVDATDATPAADTSQPLPPVDASRTHCTLDNATDPVGLCIQKLVLSAEHDAVFTDGGVAPMWDPHSGAVSGTHDFHDDVAYGAALSHYYQSAEVYGDTEIYALVAGDLISLAAIVLKELPAPPEEYGGELYANLRALAAGLRYVDDKDDANKIDALAEAYARALYTKYYHLVTNGPASDAGAPDSGASDAGDASLDAGAADSGASDASDASSADAGPPLVDAILGDLKTDHVEYIAEAAATGALALMDMAVRHAGEDAGDGAALSKAWQLAARSVLEHLWLRAREPQLGLFYTKLQTSADPGHDAPLMLSGQPADILETDREAAIMLAFTRAQDLANKNASALPSFGLSTFELRAEALLAGLNGTPSLWDKTALPSGDAGSGYFQAYVPSTGTMVLQKPIRGNALLHAALAHINAASAIPYPHQRPTLYSLFTARRPSKTSFLTQLEDQSSYLPRTTGAFDILGDDPQSQSYSAAANHAACEGLNEQWFGLH